MSIRFTCACGRLFSVRRRHGGKTIACPDCGKSLTVPGRAPAGPLAAPPDAAQSRAYREAKEDLAGGYSTEDLEAAGLLDAGPRLPDRPQDLTPTHSDPGMETFGSVAGGLSPGDLGPEDFATGPRPQIAAERVASARQARTAARALQRAGTAEKRARRSRWWIARLAVLLVVLAGMMLVYPDSPDTMRTWIDGGARAAEAVAHNDRGVELDQANKVEEAIPEFEEAIRLQPGLFEAHYNLGNALEASGRTPEALARYRDAFALNPYHAGSSFGIGAALFKTGQWQPAADQLRATLLLDDDHAEAHLYLSFALNKLERYDDAWAELQIARRLGAHFHTEYAKGLKRAMEKAR